MPTHARELRVALRYLMGGLPKYVYHVTFLHQLDSIASKGLVPGAGQTFGGGYGGHSTGRVFFTEWDGVRFWMDRYEQMANHHTDNPEEGWVPVALKIDTRGLDLQEDPAGTKDARADAYFIEDSVPAGKIKVWHDGWTSVSSADPGAMQDEVMDSAEVEEDDGEQWYEVDFEMFEPQRKASPAAVAFRHRAKSVITEMIKEIDAEIQEVLKKNAALIDAPAGPVKIAGWWAIDPKSGKEVKPPVDKGKLQNAVPGTDPETGASYIGDGPLDARLQFLDQVVAMYQESWKREPTKAEWGQLLKDPEDYELEKDEPKPKGTPKKASLGDDLRSRMRGLLSGPYDADEGAKIGKWLGDNFRIKMPRTPRGQKDLKKAANHLWYELVQRGKDKPVYNPLEGGFETSDWTYTQDQERLERIKKNVLPVWADVEPHVDDLVRYFSDEGITKVPREVKGRFGTYQNLVGLDEKKLAKYVNSLDALFGSLKGWRKKALQGGLTVVLAGPDKFRGTAGGSYRSEQDELLVRATPKVLKRTGGTYGALDYILVHELGHRYERKNSVTTDYDRREWQTTPYSRTDSLAGSEAFAELFALGHFGITRHGSDDFADVVQRFEEKMP